MIESGVGTVLTVVILQVVLTLLVFLEQCMFTFVVRCAGFIHQVIDPILHGRDETHMERIWLIFENTLTAASDDDHVASFGKCAYRVLKDL